MYTKHCVFEKTHEKALYTVGLRSMESCLEILLSFANI